MILLTGTILARYSKIRNPNIRYLQYIQSILAWQKHKIKITLCTNDGLHIPTPPGIEFITFKNNDHRGKGYGEGLIIEYALEHSANLKNIDSFYKCTGRLYVENFEQLNHDQTNLFQKNRWVDTRFYKISKEFYYSQMKQCYQLANDRTRKLYIESICARQLTQINQFNQKLQVIGVSASTKQAYGEYRPDIIQEANEWVKQHPLILNTN